MATKSKEKQKKSKSFKEELIEKRNNYIAQYERAVRFATKLEGVIEFINMQIEELNKEPEEKDESDKNS